MIGTSTGATTTAAGLVILDATSGLALMEIARSASSSDMVVIHAREAEPQPTAIEILLREVEAGTRARTIPARADLRAGVARPLPPRRRAAPRRAPWPTVLRSFS